MSGGAGSPLLLLGAEAIAQAPRLEASGYQVQLGDPQDPASWTAAGTPDLVVLAAEAAGAVRALRQALPGAVLLLDIGRDSVAARAGCLCAGAHDFWLSGIGASDLLQRLRLHAKVAAKAAPPPNRLTLADLSLVPSRHEVRRGPRSLALTAREYALLLYLMQHSGAVLSREQILKAVWHDQQGAASNVIEVYVRYLRQKLEEGGERRLIHTVRGQGYCLSDGPPPLHPVPPR
jgi:DNA-binding response OmpR family regulator